MKSALLFVAILLFTTAGLSGGLPPLVLMIMSVELLVYVAIIERYWPRSIAYRPTPKPKKKAAPRRRKGTS